MAITVYKPTPSCDGVYSFSGSQLAEYVRVHVEEAVRLEREQCALECERVYGVDERGAKGLCSADPIPLSGGAGMIRA